MHTNEHKSGKEMPQLTEVIIGCAIKVHNTLGAGFLEKVYENALVHELKKANLFIEQQKPIPVIYDSVIVGNYIADLIIERKVLLELKTAGALGDVFTAVCLNHLKATKLPVCLLINFAKPRLDWKRLVGDSYITEPVPL